MKSEINYTKARKAFELHLSNSDLHLFTGAGISMIPPSVLPSGQKLKEEIVYASAYVNTIKEYYKLLTSNPKYINVVPEIIFQDIYVTIGSKFFNSFELLTNSPSNHLHQAIAHILDNFITKNFTTNFDLLVDKNQIGTNKSVHLHGSLLNPKEMAMRIYKIGQGVGTEQQREFFDSVKNKVLFVLGYSGNDTDIIELINKSDVKEIFWLMRDSTDSWTLSNIERIKKQVFVFQDDLGDFFKAFLNRKNIRFKPDPYKIKKSPMKKYSRSLSSYEKHFVLGHLLFRISDFKNSKEVFDLMIKNKLYRSPNEYLSIIIFYTDALRVIGESYNSSISLLKSSYKIYRNIADVIKLAEIKNMIGLLILELDINPKLKPISHLTKSIELFKTALKAEKHFPDQILIKTARVHNNLGLCYDNNSIYDKADYHYKESIKIKRKLGNYLGLATSMTNLCLIHLFQGNNSKYYYWRSKTMNLIKKYSLHYRYSFLLREEGRYYKTKYLKKKARSKLEKARNIIITEIPSAIRDLQIIDELLLKL